MTGAADTKRRALSRRDFLRSFGVGLAGSAFLGVAGCGGGRGDEPVGLVFSHGEEPEVLRKQISRFNRQHRGEIEVKLRLAPADTGQYFEKLRTEFQAGEADGDIISGDIISGDVIWPAQFAAAGWISDLSEHFTEELRGSHLPAAISSNTYEGGVYG
ncbi:MAG: extracellular solute-binding protein, partial [Actinomycetota bacterium]|nr:extracellular solute-binding protein [Actinomycetota bacterium]